TGTRTDAALAPMATAMVTASALPALTPSNPGSARGLRVKDYNKAPAQAKAAPTSAPMIMRGSRSCLMTKIACSSASGSLINACHSTFSERKGDTGPAPTLRLIKQQDRISSPTKRSEEHTSELQSRFDLVCRLLLEKKKQQ